MGFFSWVGKSLTCFTRIHGSGMGSNPPSSSNVGGGLGPGFFWSEPARCESQETSVTVWLLASVNIWDSCILAQGFSSVTPKLVDQSHPE